jgi:hypothetical protein
MADAKKPISASTLAAFLAGAGLGAGTEVIIKPAVPEEPGWTCSVLANEQVFCKQDAVIVVSPDLTVTVDGGTPDAGTED